MRIEKWKIPFHLATLLRFWCCRQRRLTVANEIVRKLQLIKVAINSSPQHQLIVSPRIDHPASIQHYDLVSAMNGCEPVRDHDGSAVLHQIPQRPLNQPLALGVQRGG